MKRTGAALVALTLLSGLSMISHAQKRRKQNAVFIGGGAASGAVINQNSRARSNSGKGVKGRKLLGTTYGGDGETKLRKRVKR